MKVNVTAYVDRPKIFTRQTADELIATVDYKGFYNQKSLHSIHLKPAIKKTYRIEFLLAILNSIISTFYYRKLSDQEVDKVYAQIKIDRLKRLPIRCIEFTTPYTERRQHLEGLVEQYREGLTNGLNEKARRGKILVPDPLTELLTATGEPGETLCIPLDVMHDFLAHLAEQMIEMNKEKNALVKGFLEWLEAELKIQPDNKGNAGIEALTGKMTLKGYVGDYQKGEEHVPFETLWDLLRTNARRLRRPLDATFEQRMELEYEKSLTLLLPIKQKLAATDWLIDQLVYRLYGLTEEEVAIVQGRE